jgi:hypothetical protein
VTTPPTIAFGPASALLALIVSVALGPGCDDGAQTAVDTPHSGEFSSASACGSCHTRQYTEWEGSMMRYGAISPVFNAFELTVEKQTNGHFAPNGPAANFCNECHSPIGVYEDQIPGFVDAASATPMRDHLSAIASDGVSCDYCHSVKGADIEKSLLGDGIANVSLDAVPSDIKYGPFGAPVDSTYHPPATRSDFLRSPRFCGSCHDVRPPVDDAMTDAGFQRLENLFTEWEKSPYNDPANPTTCQDCHMSLYPWQSPGTYPMGQAVSLGSAAVAPPARRVAPHYFTGVSHALVDYPGQDDATLDQFGMPRGQKQRREAMLQAACRLDLSATPSTVSVAETEGLLPLQLTVTNVGAGHNVPAGFSQERQVWLEVTVTDAQGVIVYRSGHLTDRAHPETGELAPDGNLADEDLQDEEVVIDLATFQTASHSPGVDVDQRPFKNLGLVNFQNRFLALDEHGELEPVHAAHIADAIDNTRSLAPRTPRAIRYDIPLTLEAGANQGIDSLMSPLQVRVRLRYRTFPPLFLRTLAQLEPSLVSEDTLDRNTIVDMAEAELTIVLEDTPGL